MDNKILWLKAQLGLLALPFIISGQTPHFPIFSKFRGLEKALCFVMADAVFGQ